MESMRNTIYIDPYPIKGYWLEAKLKVKVNKGYGYEMIVITIYGTRCVIHPSMYWSLLPRKRMGLNIGTTTTTTNRGGKTLHMNVMNAWTRMKSSLGHILTRRFWSFVEVMENIEVIKHHWTNRLWPLVYQRWWRHWCQKGTSRHGSPHHVWLDHHCHR